MQKTPMISVIMGVYNPNRNQLLESLNSILMQTFQDFEIIICDDGSEKNIEVFEEIQGLDSRIILIKNNINQGLAYSLNKCIEISKGFFLARQDADDISVKDRFRIQIEFLNQHRHIDFVGSNIQYFNEEVWGHYHLKQYPEVKDMIFTPPFMHGSIIFRKSIFVDRNNLYRVSKETRRCEDYDLFMNLYSKGFRGANIQEYLYLFREDEAALNRRKFKYRLDEVSVRYKGFRKMGLSHLYDVYTVKPIVVGLVPKRVLVKLKNMFYKRLD